VSRLFTNLYPRQICADWHFIPGSAFKGSPPSFLLNAAPLFEEKWDFGPQALISNICHPRSVKRMRAWARLAANDGVLIMLFL
jgi:hypothetical protein